MLHLEAMKTSLVEILNTSPQISEKQLRFIPSNYEELRQTAAIKEYLVEKEKITDLLIGEQQTIAELKSAFTTLCEQRDARNTTTALHFLAMPESVCNRLYWDLTMQLFAPKHLGEIIAILMPSVVAFLTMDFTRNPGDDSKSMTRVQLKLQTQDLTALETYPPRLAILTKCIIADQLIFPIKQMAKLPFHFQQKLYAQLDQYPTIKKRLYSHNADLQKTALNIELIERNGKTLEEMITTFAFELRRSGQRFTGNVFAADSVAVSISNFLTYLESMPATIRSTIAFLENDAKTMSISKVLYNLGLGECVEMSADTLLAIRDNPDNSVIMQQYPKLAKHEYHKITHAYGRTKLEMQGFDTTTKLPDALRRQIIQNIRITSTYDYIDLLLNLPSEEYQTILEHAVITCVPPLPDNLPRNMTMFTLEQCFTFVDAALQHRHRLGGIEAITILATSIFRRIQNETLSVTHEKVKRQLLRVIEIEIGHFSQYNIAMEFMLTVCQKDDIENKLSTFPILDRIQIAIDYNVVNIIKTNINRQVTAILPQLKQNTFLLTALGKQHIEIAKHLLCNGFVFNKSILLSHFSNQYSEIMIAAFHHSYLLREKFRESFVREYAEIERLGGQAGMLAFYAKIVPPEEINSLIALLPASERALLIIKLNHPGLMQLLLTNELANNKNASNGLLRYALPQRVEIAEMLVQNGSTFNLWLLHQVCTNETYHAAVMSSVILSEAFLNAFLDQYANSEINCHAGVLHDLLQSNQLPAIPLRLPAEEKCRLAVKAGNLACLKHHLGSLHDGALQTIKPILLADAIISSQADIVLYLLETGAQLGSAEIITISHPSNQSQWGIIKNQSLISKQIINHIICCISQISNFELDKIIHFCYCLLQEDPMTFRTILKQIKAPHNLLIANAYGCTDVVDELVATYAETQPAHLTSILQRAIVAEHSFLFEAALAAGAYITEILHTKYLPYIQSCASVTSAFLTAISKQAPQFSAAILERAVSWYHQLSTPEAFEPFILSLPDREQIYFAAKYGLLNIIKQFASQFDLLNGYCHDCLPLQVAIDALQFDVATALLDSGVDCYKLMYYTQMTAVGIKQGFETHPAFRQAFLHAAINQADKISYGTPMITYIKEATSPVAFSNFLGDLPAYHHLYQVLRTNTAEAIESFNRYAAIENRDDPNNHVLFELAVFNHNYTVAAQLLQVNDNVVQFLSLVPGRLMGYLRQIKEHRVLSQLLVNAIDKHLEKIELTPVIADFYLQSTDEVRFKQLILRLSPPTQFYYACCYNMLDVVDRYLTNAEITTKMDLDFTSPLLEAMRQNHDAVVERLLMQKLWINTTSFYFKESDLGFDRIDTTPLTYALKLKRIDYAKQLLQQGAVVTRDAFKLAIFGHHIEIVKTMLEQTNEYDHLNINKKSLLAWAVIDKQQDIIDILIKRFTLKNIYDEDQLLTPVYWAVKQGDLTMVKQLLAFHVPIGPLGCNILTETADPKICVLLKLALLIADHNASNQYQGLGDVWQHTLTSSNFFNQTQRYADTNLNSAVNLLNDLLASEAITLKKPNKTIFADNPSLHAIYREAKLAFKA